MLKVSIYKDQTWIGYKPGQDKTFPTAYVSRSNNGKLHSVVNKLYDLLENCVRCQVNLKWYDEPNKILSYVDMKKDLKTAIDLSSI